MKGAKRKVSPKFAGETPATPIFWPATPVISGSASAVFFAFLQKKDLQLCKNRDRFTGSLDNQPQVMYNLRQIDTQ